jgi:uncharacterized protein
LAADTLADLAKDRRTIPMPRKLAVITGASAGIGEVFARKLAPKYDLLLVARRLDRLEKIAAELMARNGGVVKVMEADLADRRGMEAVAQRIAGEPDLALLVNNAGFGNRGLFWEKEFEESDRMHSLHVTATLRLSHAALRNMVPRDCGAIINVASVASFVRRAGSSSYSATKSWMAVFTEGLYLELQSAKSAVTVQALCPGFTYSEFHDTMKVERSSMAPKSFWLRADDVVDASLKGLRSKKLFVIPGFQYKILTAVFTKLPVGARLAVEKSRKGPKNTE